MLRDYVRKNKKGGRGEYKRRKKHKVEEGEEEN